MEKVQTILSKKQPHFHTISSDLTVNNALHKMSCENTEYLIVMEDNSFLGVLTEHDITSKAIFADLLLNKTMVKQIMNTRLPIADSNDTLERCMHLMRQFNVRFLPVFENFRFCGIVTSDDILQEAVTNRTEIFDEKADTLVFEKFY